VDGSIATRNRQPIGLSGPKSMLLTHQIRACSDAILIGIGTILADDPRLNVRLVDGKNPQPIILDTHLRTPVNAKLVKRPDTRPWLINAAGPDNKRFQALCGAGTTPIDCNTSADGKIDLQSLMQILSVRGINSVMVEGGAQVITSFVNARLVDQFVVTISPRFIGGLSVLNSNGMHVDTNLELTEVSYRSLGDDLIIWAQPKWRRNLSAANNIDSD
jgi:3,4-dihydroxy 2-butanone 4-phosphate synthase/GTP cyclohydrolase II